MITPALTAALLLMSAAVDDNPPTPTDPHLAERKSAVKMVISNHPRRPLPVLTGYQRHFRPIGWPPQGWKRRV
jgi:hypothetical protein